MGFHNKHCYQIVLQIIYPTFAIFYYRGFQF